MINLTSRRLCLVLALALAGMPAFWRLAAQQPAFKSAQFDGKVVPLTGLLEKQGAKLDADAAAQMMALVKEDGTIYTLVKDDFTRMFFKDKTLLNRPMRLTGRVIPNSQMLQVIQVNSVVQGKLHEVYYWCETCGIRALEPGDCACCSAKLELREVPVP